MNFKEEQTYRLKQQLRYIKNIYPKIYQESYNYMLSIGTEKDVLEVLKW